MVLFRPKSSHCCCIDANVQHGILWALLLLLIWFHTGVDYSVSSTFIIIFFFFFFFFGFFGFLVFLSYLFKEHKSHFLLFFFFFLLPFTFFFTQFCLFSICLSFFFLFFLFYSFNPLHLYHHALSRPFYQVCLWKL